MWKAGSQRELPSAGLLPTNLQRPARHSQEPETSATSPTRVLGTQVLGSPSAASPGALIRNRVGPVAARTWTSTQMGCWLCRQCHNIAFGLLHRTCNTTSVIMALLYFFLTLLINRLIWLRVYQICVFKKSAVVFGFINFSDFSLTDFCSRFVCVCVVSFLSVSFRCH